MCLDLTRNILSGLLSIQDRNTALVESKTNLHLYQRDKNITAANCTKNTPTYNKLKMCTVICINQNLYQQVVMMGGTETDRQTDRDRDIERQRERQRQRDRDRERQREREMGGGHR